jgi:hypothetical protein
VRTRLWISLLVTPLAISSAAAASGRISIGSTGWTVKAPNGFSAKRSKFFDLELVGPLDKKGRRIRISFRKGWRESPIACPGEDGKPVLPPAPPVESRQDGRTTLSYSCPISKSGAMDHRRIFVLGERLGDEHGFLSAVLKITREKKGFIPESELDESIRARGLAEFERTCASLRPAGTSKKKGRR